MIDVTFTEPSFNHPLLRKIRGITLVVLEELKEETLRRHPSHESQISSLFETYAYSTVKEAMLQVTKNNPLSLSYEPNNPNIHPERIQRNIRYLAPMSEEEVTEMLSEEASIGLSWYVLGTLDLPKGLYLILATIHNNANLNKNPCIEIIDPSPLRKGDWMVTLGSKPEPGGAYITVPLGVLYLAEDQSEMLAMYISLSDSAEIVGSSVISLR